MEKYPRGTQGPFSIPLLIKAEILFRENHSLGQDWIGKDGLMWAGSQSHCSDAPILQICLLMARMLIMNKRTPGCISDLHLLQAFIIQLRGTQPAANADMLLNGETAGNSKYNLSFDVTINIIPSNFSE